MLIGENLLARVQAMPSSSRCALVRACGYARFSRALLEAKGVPPSPPPGPGPLGPC